MKASILIQCVACTQVKDICNELDVRSLCHKILQNVSMLLHADRGSLFLVQGDRPEREETVDGQVTPPRPRMLVSKLFDVCSQSTLQLSLIHI